MTSRRHERVSKMTAKANVKTLQTQNAAIDRTVRAAKIGVAQLFTNNLATEDQRGIAALELAKSLTDDATNTLRHRHRNATLGKIKA